MAFLISTPESGVDSMAITYALLDPIMTIARPIAAFVTAMTAGILENMFGKRDEVPFQNVPDLSCTVDGCCDGLDCSPDEHQSHHNGIEKIRAGLIYAFGELWDDIAVWFLVGIVLAGVITVLIPVDVMTHYLGGGLPAMLLMLVAGIPLYICATASTPIAAVLILKGISPGAALVFLLVGPATNITSLTVLFEILGKRATALYLFAIAFSAVTFGLALDQIYSLFGISAKVIAGEAAEIIPHWVKLAGAFILLGLSIRPVYKVIHSKLAR